MADNNLPNCVPLEIYKPDEIPLEEDKEFMINKDIDSHALADQLDDFSNEYGDQWLIEQLQQWLDTRMGNGNYKIITGGKNA